MYNYSRLLGKIRECGFSQESLAKKVGMGATSLNLTLNNKRVFRQDEIQKVAAALGIEPVQYEAYFFAH